MTPLSQQRSAPMRHMAPLAFFAMRVARIRDLSPSLRRFTFTSVDADQFGDPGFDQRVKVVFPTPWTPLTMMPTGEDWYSQWRALEESARPPFRTYTTRDVRHNQREVDIDMVVHAVQGPASRWIAEAQPGGEVLIIAPTTAYRGVSSGIDFVPPARTAHYLLVGDETAAPALARILEQLPQEARGTVACELPHVGDSAYIPNHPGFERHILTRAHAPRHSLLVPRVREIAHRLIQKGSAHPVEEIDIEKNLIWEVPRTAKGGAALKSTPVYAWLAGEADAIKQLRRYIVADLGLDRRSVAFMGYWREGRAEM